MSEGVRPESICIGHSGDSDDLEYLTELAERGVFLGMDRYGAEEKLTFDRRNAAVVEMARRGYAGHMLLSQDHSIVRDLIYQPEVLKQRATWTTTLVLEKVLPTLARLGLDSALVQRFVTDNPARWLTPR